MSVSQIVAGLLVLAAASACDSAQDQQSDAGILMQFDTARVRIVTRADTIPLTLELARSEQQKTMGLMERRQLADSAGMLFLYDVDQPKTAAFWMFHTRIPLDIAFVDSAGVIGAIVRMEPCTSATAQACPTYPPGVPYRAALEVNAGYFGRHNVKVGDRVMLSDAAKKAP